MCPIALAYNYSVNGSTLQMYSNANVYGGDVLHGPYMVSKEPVYVAAGSDLSFEWRAQGGERRLRCLCLCSEHGYW